MGPSLLSCRRARETAKGDSLLILYVLSQMKLPKMNPECLVMAKCSMESGDCLSVLRPESWLLGSWGHALVSSVVTGAVWAWVDLGYTYR